MRTQPRSLNAVHRHYTPEQRQALVPILRDQGFSYRAIAEALGVGKSTVYRDAFGELRIRPEESEHTEIVPHGTMPAVITEPPTQDVSPPPTYDTEIVSHGTMPTVATESPEHAEIVPSGTMPDPRRAERDVVAPPAEPPQRVKRKGGGTYPAQRPSSTRAPKPPSTERELSHVIDYLMRHALDWHDKDWQGFLQVVENLSTSRQAKATGQPVRASIE